MHLGKSKVNSGKMLPPVGIEPGTLGLQVARLVLHSHDFLTLFQAFITNVATVIYISGNPNEKL